MGLAVIIKVLSVVGARPQLMKAAILSELFDQSDDFAEILIHTGQHYDPNMSSDLLGELFFKAPDYQLECGGVDELKMLSELIVGIADIIEREAPDVVVSYGDTTTTLAGALAARKSNIVHVHVEAGVRNFDMQMPEEVNRVIIDRISDLNFCATERGVRNLIRESVLSGSKTSHLFSGDLMLDCFIKHSSQATPLIDALQPNNTIDEEYVYVTFHRKSNVDDRRQLGEIVEALNEINSNIRVILPLHPRTKRRLEEFKLNLSFQSIPPVSYYNSLGLIKSASTVITDSGGVVREAFFAKKPSLFLLEDPVWPEIEDVGCSVSAAQITSASILRQYELSKTLQGNFEAPIFGDGSAGLKIVAAIREHFTYK